MNLFSRKKSSRFNFKYLPHSILYVTKKGFICSTLFQPPRLVSPDTLLRLRAGNCFEMATLLCSLLIANRYGALVVSGYASREVANNDQTRVTCPDIPIRSSRQPEVRMHVNNCISRMNLNHLNLCYIHSHLAKTRKKDTIRANVEE